MTFTNGHPLVPTEIISRIINGGPPITKIAHGIPMTRLFYQPEELPSLEEIDAEIETVLKTIPACLQEVKE